MGRFGAERCAVWLIARYSAGYAACSDVELVWWLKKHGLTETEASITMKPTRGTFPATFFLAALRAIGVESRRGIGVRLGGF
jgi:Domain of unknown function (DUF6471)